MEGLRTIEDIDFSFTNSPVKIVILRDAPELTKFHQKGEPFKAGQETEVPYWVAKTLVATGVAKFRDEDSLTLQSLSKIHWRETIPSSRQLPQLQPDFYCHLRRFLVQLHAETRKDVSRVKDFEKAEGLSKDIVNVRTKKIVSLAAAPTPSEEIINSLTLEERALYWKLNEIVNEWQAKILTAPAEV